MQARNKNLSITAALAAADEAAELAVDSTISNCRGIWVAILEDEEDPPAIAGIPQSLRDRFGDAVNDLLQPKKPQTQKR